MIENLSCTTGTTVYGSRSWTGAIGLFNGFNPSQPNPDRFSDNQSSLGWEYLGQWNMSSNGTRVETLKNGIRFTGTGNVKHNRWSPASKISKAAKKIKDRFF